MPITGAVEHHPLLVSGETGSPSASTGSVQTPGVTAMAASTELPDTSGAVLTTRRLFPSDALYPSEILYPLSGLALNDADGLLSGPTSAVLGQVS